MRQLVDKCGDVDDNGDDDVHNDLSCENGEDNHAHADDFDDEGNGDSESASDGGDFCNVDVASCEYHVDAVEVGDDL